MKKFIIIGWLSVTVVLQAGSWKNLDPIESYPASAFHLKKDVACLDIRGYPSAKSTKVSRKVTICPVGIPPKLLSKFNALKPVRTGKSDIRDFGNAFLLDTKGRMYRMDMKKDIIGLLGKIDRPAEAQLILWLHYEDDGRYFKKTSKGYQVKSIGPPKGCTSLKRVVTVDKFGNYHSNEKYTLLRKGCKKRKHTRFIENKKVNYRSYAKIALDDKGDLYLIGYGSRDKNEFYLLEKYTNRGKRVWSQKLKGYASNLIVKNGLVSVFDDKKLKAIYSFNGKKSSSGKLVAVRAEEKYTNDKKYLPEGLPNKKELIDFYLSDSVKDKKGNVYIVGSEIFYPGGSPEEIPTGECGNVESVEGALVAKLDKNGKTIWAKVIDRDE